MNQESKQPSSSALRIAILGAGGVGSTFAFHFAKAGHDVTAIARPRSARLQRLLCDRGVINTAGQRAEMRVMDELDTEVPYDLVLVTLLAHQVDAVIPKLQRSAARWIQFMFNNFEPERLQDAVGAERCSFGMPFVQARIDADGRLKAQTAGQKSKMNNRALVDTFIAARLPACFEPDILLWLRCHVPVGAALESACVAGMRRGGGASWSESLTIARGMQESLTLIQRLGYSLYPRFKLLLRASPAWAVAGLLWSLSRIPSFRELLATGLNESRALVDVLAASALQAKQPVAVDRILAMKP